MKNFENYLAEGKDEPYQLIVFANTSEDIRDIGKQDRPDYAVINDAAKAVGVDIQHVVYKFICF